VSSRSPELPAAFLGAPLAHRGLHDRAAGRIENSRAAVAAAVAAGCGIEIDVQRAADGVAMVFHDEALPRLTGAPGLLAERTAAELGRLRLTGGDEGIPTLAEILALVAGRAALLVEVKDQDGALGPAVGPLEARVAELLGGYTGPMAVMSFNPHAVAELAEAAPGVARGLVTCAFDRADWSLPDYRRAELAGIADFDRVGASFVSHDRRDLASPPVARLKARGAPVLCWTVRSPAEEATARAVADNITFEGYRPERRAVASSTDRTTGGWPPV
jgi:glycerophosphoryl diester phosphodiesterase